ncbi:MAG: pyrimidine/purine nucleosidase domain-containing protein, partial [Pseudomonadota bacterium]|nr:pyrimidine/purine nucleosidase domain-containing protein [Pseudomonadota bacterium]
MSTAEMPRQDVARARVRPRGALELLSQFEADLVKRFEEEETRELFRRCCLAVLNSGNDSDDAAALFERYADFRAEVLQSPRGVQLELSQAPARAFVDGRMVEGVK